MRLLFGINQSLTIYQEALLMVDYLRRQDSERWHWSKDCPDFPEEIDVLIYHIEPDYGLLCEVCEEKEPLE